MSQNTPSSTPKKYHTIRFDIFQERKKMIAGPFGLQFLAQKPLSWEKYKKFLLKCCKFCFFKDCLKLAI
jgi:hypothetical protein